MRMSVLLYVAGFQIILNVKKIVYCLLEFADIFFAWFPRMYTHIEFLILISSLIYYKKCKC